jgi:hypothetical protein
MKQIQKVIDELTKKAERLEIDKRVLTVELYTIYSVIDSLNEAAQEEPDQDVKSTVHVFQGLGTSGICGICGLPQSEHYLKHSE